MQSIQVTEEHPYYMTISLNVLNHLGIHLYSNIPSVLSEIIANAWDADATEVKIKVAEDKQSIIITDNGVGMTAEDINAKFLHVGYRKRENGEEKTPSGRKVMGRKGIGKLSMFSIETISGLTARTSSPNLLSRFHFSGAASLFV
jgi:HSP90 family molecular chaperone